MAEPADTPVALGGENMADVPSDTPGAFAFEARRARMDWRAIHAVDVDRVMRENDIDTLESVLETVTFGDVSVEDSRYLTTSNARKVIRLAQCQVEYLLHVQETLATHKERLRGVAETAQRESITAKAESKEHRAKARCARTELRKTRKALKTYEVLEQIRAGTPLEEILLGTAQGSDTNGDKSSTGLDKSHRLDTDGDENENAAVNAFARAAAKARDAEAFEKRAVAAEAKCAEAVSYAEKLTVELGNSATQRGLALEALESAKKQAAARNASSCETFEKRLAQLEVELVDAKQQAERALAASAVDAAAADAARARANDMERHQREAELNELRRSVKSVGDGSATEAATALAAATAAERRLADLEARDGEIIAELRQRLAAKDEECARLRVKRDALETQLVSLASGAGLGGGESLMHSVHGTPLVSAAGTPIRTGSYSLSRRSGDAIADELRAHLERAEDPELREVLEKAKGEMRKAMAVAEDAKHAKDEVERLRLSIASDEAKAAKEEIARLTIFNSREIARLTKERETETRRLTEQLQKETTRLEDDALRLRLEKEEEREKFVRERDDETALLRKEREAALRERDLEKARLLEETARLREQREAAIAERDNEKHLLGRERDNEKRLLLEERQLEQSKIREERAAETARVMEDLDREKDLLSLERTREKETARRESAKVLEERQAETKRRVEERLGEKETLLKETTRLAQERDLEKETARKERDALLKENEETRETALREREALLKEKEETKETALREREALLKEKEETLSKIREEGSKEVAALRLANEKLSETAEAARQNAERAKRAELETREKALRDAEASERRVFAAAAALEKEHALRELELEKFASLRKSSPERAAASATVAAELKLLRETIAAVRTADGGPGSLVSTPAKAAQESVAPAVAASTVAAMRMTEDAPVPESAVNSDYDTAVDSDSDTSLPDSDSFLRDATRRAWDETLGSPTTIPDVTPDPELSESVSLHDPVPAAKATAAAGTTETMSRKQSEDAEVPTVEVVAETGKVEVEAPKVETEKVEVEAPKVETEEVQVEAPKVETERVEVETEKAETTKVEVETPTEEPETGKVEVEPKKEKVEPKPVPTETEEKVEPKPAPGKKKKGKKKKGQGGKTQKDFSEAPSTAVTASVEPESRVQTGENEAGAIEIEEIEIAETSEVAEPAVTANSLSSEEKEEDTSNESSSFDPSQTRKEKELEIATVLREKKKQIAEVLAEKKAAIDAIFEARKVSIERVANKKKSRAELATQKEAQTRVAEEALSKQIEEEKARAIAEAQAEKRKAEDEARAGKAKETANKLRESQIAIEQMQTEKQKLIDDVAHMEQSAKAVAVAEIQAEIQKALDEVQKEEEEQKNAVVAEITAMKQSAIAEIAERREREEQRTIAQMMQTHAREAEKAEAEKEAAEKAAAEAVAVEAAEAEAAAAEAAAAEAAAAEAAAAAADAAAQQASAHPAASSESDMDEIIIHEDVSDEAARPDMLLVLAPVDDMVLQSAPQVLLPHIPVVTSIPSVADEPDAMDPKKADEMISQHVSRVAFATRQMEKEQQALMAIIDAAPAAGTKTAPPQGAVPNASPRVMKDSVAKTAAAEEAKERLVEVRAAACATAADAARAVARAANAPPFLTESDKTEWLAKHPHQPIARAPYALSRHASHDAELFDAAEEAVVAYLEEQVTNQLVNVGVAVTETNLDDTRYIRMMHEFRQKRNLEVDDLSTLDKKKYQVERACILNHVARASRAVMATRNRNSATDETETEADDATAKFLFPETLTDDKLAAAVPKVMQGKSVRESLE